MCTADFEQRWLQQHFNAEQLDNGKPSSCITMPHVTEAVWHKVTTLDSSFIHMLFLHQLSSDVTWSSPPKSLVKHLRKFARKSTTMSS